MSSPAAAGADPDLSIVIVNWNGRELVLDCLASIRDAKLGLAAEVIAVDNASTDGSVEAIRRQFPEVRVVALDRNIGFAGGNNRGLECMRGRHALLLNSDTIVLRGALERCVAYLDDHPEVGVVGPQLLNPDRSKQNCIHNSPTVLSELFSQSLLRRLWPTRYPGRRVEYSAPIEVEAVLGACLFARREVIEQVGPLDEEYFFQLEDTDWCHRVRAADWKVVHVPDARVIHLYGESGKKRSPLRTRIEYQRGRDLFFAKHRGPLARAGLFATISLKLALGSVLGGRRAAEYRKILVWRLRGRPEGAGLRPPADAGPGVSHGEKQSMDAASTGARP